MNRQIKFRGKLKDTGEWVYGYVVEYITGKCVIYEPVVSSVTANDVYEYQVIPETIGQFTGLLDKNGKEIYEGDIFGLPNKDGIKQHFYRIVEYCCDGFYLIDNCHEGKYGDLLHREISLDGHYAGMAKTLRHFGCDYCVVGNIHDNPELIKNK